MSSLIKLNNIKKNYTIGNQTHIALNDVSFEVAFGDMIAIVGASGSGKSTLLNIIGLLDKPNGGEYFFNGQNIFHLNEKELAVIRNKRIGFIFQSFFLLPRLNAMQNVMLPLFYRGIETKSAKKMASNMLAQMGLLNFAHHRPNELSGGQQQRVAIARALVGEPDLILADEPTGALDSKTSQEIMAILLDLNQTKGKTIIIITHDQKVSEKCKKCVNIKDGQIE